MDDEQQSQVGSQVSSSRSSIASIHEEPVSMQSVITDLIDRLSEKRTPVRRLLLYIHFLPLMAADSASSFYDTKLIKIYHDLLYFTSG